MSYKERRIFTLISYDFASQLQYLTLETTQGTTQLLT